MAYDDGFYYGQCKLICTAVDSSMDGKSITATATDGFSAAAMGTIQGGKCTLTVPGRALYKVEVDGYSKDVECGYGDCIVVYLADGYDNINQKDLLGLEDIEKNVNLEFKAASANAVKDVLDDKLGGCILSVIDNEFYITNTKEGADAVPKKLGKLEPDLIGVSVTGKGSNIGGETAAMSGTSTLAMTYAVKDFTKVKWSSIATNKKSFTRIRGTNDNPFGKNVTWTVINSAPLDGIWYDIKDFDYCELYATYTQANTGTVPRIAGIEWSKATE